MLEAWARAARAVFVGSRIKDPELRTRVRVQGDHAGIHRGQIQHVVDHERRGLEPAGPRAVFGQGHFSRLPFPRDFQLIDIRRGDVCRGRVLGVGVFGANGRPLDHAVLLRLGDERRGGDQDQDRAESFHADVPPCRTGRSVAVKILEGRHGTGDYSLGVWKMFQLTLPAPFGEYNPAILSQCSEE